MRKPLATMQIKFKKVVIHPLTVLALMLRYIVMEMMMKAAEMGGVGMFFMAYVFGITVYIVGGFDEFVKEMKASFGKVAA